MTQTAERQGLSLPWPRAEYQRKVDGRSPHHRASPHGEDKPCRSLA